MANITKLPIIRSVSSNGTVFYGNSKYRYHREDGPAFIVPNQSENWYIHNLRHRLDGPAIVYASGRCDWFKLGKRHREDGPAVYGAGLYEDFFLEGIRYLEKDYYIAIKQIRRKKAQEQAEKFADRYFSSPKKKEAGIAILEFLVGECSHTFIKNNICELCSVTNIKPITPVQKVSISK